MENKLFQGIALAVALVGTTLLLGGCADKVTKEDVWNDMSPEMHSMSRNEDQRKSDILRALDTNARQIPDDWDFIWLQQRPLYMSDYPVP